jgi:hypothetical protein
MEKGIATQLEARRKKAREGKDLDADMRAIDAETACKEHEQSIESN